MEDKSIKEKHRGMTNYRGFFFFGSALNTLQQQQQQQQQALILNFWGRLWILSKLVRVGHMNSFPPLYSI